MNMRDAAQKGRMARLAGEANGNAKLTEQKVLGIRKQAQEGYSQRAIATMFGTTQACVSLVIQRKTWRHVK